MPQDMQTGPATPPLVQVLSWWCNFARVARYARPPRLSVRGHVLEVAIVAAALRNVPGVSETARLAGPWDVIGRAHARDIDELAKQVACRVQALEGVTRTMGCPVVHPEETAHCGAPHHHLPGG
jgi:DNA-binding Lrp family transcriptional regulator